jgi:hypothetical protein
MITVRIIFHDSLLKNVPCRQFFSLVEFETKKKKAAAKEAGQYLERLTKNIDRDEQELKKQLGDLTSASYVTLGRFRDMT